MANHEEPSCEIRAKPAGNRELNKAAAVVSASMHSKSA
jgi:hypothetical protein